MSETYFDIGDKAYCKSCTNPVYEATKTVYVFDVPTSSTFKSIGDYPDPTPCDPIICPICKMSFSSVTRFLKKADPA